MKALKTHCKLQAVILCKLKNYNFLIASSYVAGCPTSLQLFMKLIDELCTMTDDDLELVVE